jgi:hypothetical protein
LSQICLSKNHKKGRQSVRTHNQNCEILYFLFLLLALSTSTTHTAHSTFTTTTRPPRPVPAELPL